jgi:hypothetical protein
MANLMVNDFGAHPVRNLKSVTIFSRLHLVADSQKKNGRNSTGVCQGQSALDATAWFGQFPVRLE